MIGELTSEGSLPRKLPADVQIHANMEPLANTDSSASGSILYTPSCDGVFFTGIQIVFGRNQQNKILKGGLWVFEPLHLLFRLFL